MLTACSIDFYEPCGDHGCKPLPGEHDLGGVCAFSFFLPLELEHKRRSKTHANAAIKIQ